MEIYLSGKKLYGDDFTRAQLESWYAGEVEGYSSILRDSGRTYAYHYHAVNRLHGFRHIELPEKSHALGIGSAHCDEFLPVLPKLARITALEPSAAFVIDQFEGVPVSFVRPTVEGGMPFENGTFDLVTAFGVLHHIANVSFVMSECSRCLKPGGYMLLREPIVSMGDWRRPRRGLTRNERGIPLHLLEEMVPRSGLEIVRKTLCDFSPLGRVLAKFGVATFTSRTGSLIDAALSRAFAFNQKYHRVSLLEKLGPAGVFLVCRKPAASQQ